MHSGTAFRGGNMQCRIRIRQKKVYLQSGLKWPLKCRLVSSTLGVGTERLSLSPHLFSTSFCLSMSSALHPSLTNSLLHRDTEAESSYNLQWNWAISENSLIFSSHWTLLPSEPVPGQRRGKKHLQESTQNAIAQSLCLSQTSTTVNRWEAWQILKHGTW